jgi:hypothetical protein
MTITQFDRQNIRMLEQKCEAALRSVAEEYGLTVRVAGGTFDQDFWKAKFKFEPRDTPAAKSIWKSVRRRHDGTGWNPAEHDGTGWDPAG